MDYLLGDTSHFGMCPYFRITMGLMNDLRVFFERHALDYQVEIALVYGSWAAGLEREDSDVDVAVVFKKTVTDKERAFFLITEISYRLSEQLKKEVNVISIDNDFSHPMLYYNAFILGKTVFISDRHRYADLVFEIIEQMEDFQIFGVPWQKEAARNIMEGLKNA